MAGLTNPNHNITRNLTTTTPSTLPTSSPQTPTNMATHSLTRTCAHLPSFSSARIFLQIAPRHLHTSTPLDFLLPSIPATLHRQLPLPLTPRSHIIKAKTQTRGQRRAFTAAAVTQQTRTKVLENPKIDEDGQEMSIEITPRASNVRCPSHFKT